jgi:predicted RNase H-like HicB family nuclease
MASFIAIVTRDGDAGYTASFPDFPACAVGGPTIDVVIAKAREALSMHIERLLEANQRICIPTAADAIERGDAFLLAAVDVPDDLRIAHVDLAIPALSLVRIDALAQRCGLTRSALFVEAINRWALRETVARERRAGASDGPTLFDLGNPLELRVEAITAAVDPPDRPATDKRDTGERDDTEANLGDITAELVRLLEGATEPPPTEAAADGQRNRPTRKRE